MAYIFQIIETEALPALSVKTVTSISNLPNEIGRIYGSIVAYLAQKGEEPLGPAFVGYHNMDMEKLEVEIGFPVAKETVGAGEIISSSIPAGKKATGIHKGPYREISSTYAALGKWLAEKGYTPSGMVFEFYYNSPQEVPESELLTQIQFLLS